MLSEALTTLIFCEQQREKKETPAYSLYLRLLWTQVCEKKSACPRFPCPRFPLYRWGKDPEKNHGLGTSCHPHMDTFAWRINSGSTDRHYFEKKSALSTIPLDDSTCVHDSTRRCRPAELHGAMARLGRMRPISWPRTHWRLFHTSCRRRLIPFWEVIHYVHRDRHRSRHPSCLHGSPCPIPQADLGMACRGQDGHVENST